jgi:hypothetical protein
VLDESGRIREGADLKCWYFSAETFHIKARPPFFGFARQGAGNVFTVEFMHNKTCS